MKNWISDSFCLSQCLAQKQNTHSIDVIALEVHTRYTSIYYGAVDIKIGLTLKLVVIGSTYVMVGQVSCGTNVVGINVCGAHASITVFATLTE